jgi:hypothetical protein
VHDRAAGEAYPIVGIPLLPGETADSQDRDDVEHWVAVYEQLTCFLTNFNAPDAMLQRYRQRLQFWGARRAALARPASRNGHWSEAAE